MATAFRDDFAFDELERRLRTLDADLARAKEDQSTVLLVEQRAGNWKGGFSFEPPSYILRMGILGPKATTQVPRFRKDRSLADHLSIDTPNAIYMTGNGQHWLLQKGPITIEPDTVRAFSRDITRIEDPERGTRFRVGFLVYLDSERILDFLKERITGYDPGIMRSYVKMATQLRREVH